MVKHKISWRNAGEIPPGFLQEILKLIMEKNEVCFYLNKHCTCITQKLSAKKVPDYTYLNYKSYFKPHNQWSCKCSPDKYSAQKANFATTSLKHYCWVQ